MASLTIDLSDSMKEFIEIKAAERGFGSPGEFVLDLLRTCQAREAIDRKLLAAVDSGQFEDVTPALWERLRSRLAAGGGDTIRDWREFAAGRSADSQTT